MSFIAAILKPYAAADWLVKQKARTLLIAVVIGSMVPAVDLVVSWLFMGHPTPTIFSDIFIIILALIDIALLMSGRYLAASTLASIAVFIDVIIALYLGTGRFSSDPVYDITQNACNLMIVMFFTAVIAERAVQTIGIACASVLVAGGYIVFMRTGVTPDRLAVYDTVSVGAFLFVVLSGIMAYLVIYNSRKAIDVAREKGRTSSENEQKFRTIFESVNDAIIVQDIDTGRVIDANRKLCEMFRCTPEDVQTLSIIDFSSNIPPFTADEAARWFQRAVHEGPQVFEWQTKDRTGRYFWIEASMQCTVIGGAERLLVVVRDITSRKQSEERIAAYTAELERSYRDLQDFAYIASHDLQEPLRKVRTFGDLLIKKSGDAVGEEGRGYINRMQQSMTRMQKLITDLLAYSRVGTRGGIFEHMRLDDALDDALETLDLAIETAHARIERLPLPEIDADRSQMRQLFQNIIANAVKFRKPDVPPHIRISARLADEACIEIAIEDNGIGFDETYRDKIFIIFQRLHGRDEFDGTGVGLAICKKIVERHGGTIAAESSVGSGSRFIIRLPRTHIPS
ncbi:MAG: PAS domain S-box protein [Spirochaetes bacterium]|nr:PAS domain S-box protein [Spirochaetota bacterium]